MDKWNGRKDSVRLVQIVERIWSANVRLMPAAIYRSFCQGKRHHEEASRAWPVNLQFIERSLIV